MTAHAPSSTRGAGSAAVVEFVCSEVLDALTGGDVDDAEPGQWIGPPPAEQR
jgi:hypothetical protein